MQQRAIPGPVYLGFGIDTHTLGNKGVLFWSTELRSLPAPVRRGVCVLCLLFCTAAATARAGPAWCCPCSLAPKARWASGVSFSRGRDLCGNDSMRVHGRATRESGTGERRTGERRTVHLSWETGERSARMQVWSRRAIASPAHYCATRRCCLHTNRLLRCRTEQEVTPSFPTMHVVPPCWVGAPDSAGAPRRRGH